VNPITRIFGGRGEAISHATAARIAGAAPQLVLPTAFATVSQRSRCPYVDEQTGLMCVEDSVEQLRHLAVAFQGARGSARFLYEAARVRERARKTDPIPDTGSTVGDMLDAACEVGIPPRDDRDGELPAINEMNTWDETAAAQLFVPGHFAIISDGDLATLDRYLSWGAARTDGGGCGVQFTMAATQGYMQLRGPGAGSRWSGARPGDPVRGLHAQGIVGYTGLAGSDFYEVWGTWGTAFADQGFAYIRRDVVRSQGATFVAVTGGPVL
jgi:hypothetical protein